MVWICVFRLSEAASRPREERTFISRPKFEDSGSSNSLNVSDPTPHQPSAPPRVSAPEIPAPTPVAPASVPSARAMYDFEPGEVFDISSLIFN